MVVVSRPNKIGIIHVSLKCILRDYTYVAHMSAKTGELMYISAGCRTWPTFAGADLHYDGALGKEHWRDGICISFIAQSHRLEARTILTRLRTAHFNVMDKIRHKAAQEARLKRESARSARKAKREARRLEADTARRKAKKHVAAKVVRRAKGAE